MRYFLCYFVSFLLGYLFINAFTKNGQRLPFYFTVFIALGVGLGLSAQITFYSFVLFDALNKTFVISAHGLLILILALTYLNANKKEIKSLWPIPTLTKDFLQESSFILLIAVGMIPCLLEANLYPYGGWDAWSVWNLKSRFLFLGNHHWRDMFDPLLWRSSPHYPLFLPLVNVWGWIILGKANYQIPLINSLIFTFLTAGLLFSGLKLFLKKNIPCLLAVLAVLALPYFVKLATDQYSDTIVGYYLLGSLLCLMVAQEKQTPFLATVCGLFLGFLSFTKNEGLVAALIMGIAAFYYLKAQVQKSEDGKRGLGYMLAGFFISALPPLIFYFFWAPHNQTFINGLTSSAHPANLNRFIFIGYFLWLELTSKKWFGIWFILIAGLILSGRKAFGPAILIIPLFILLYLATVCFYYFLNTYFDLAWWLSVSMGRILFSILPLGIFWTFYALWRDGQADKP